MPPKQTMAPDKLLGLMVDAGLWLPTNPRFRDLFGDVVKECLIHGSKYGDFRSLDQILAAIPTEEERDRIRARLCERFGMYAKQPGGSLRFASPEAKELLPKNHRGLLGCYTLLHDCATTVDTNAIHLAREDLTLNEFIALALDTLTLFRSRITPTQLDEIESITGLLRQRLKQDQETDASTQ